MFITYNENRSKTIFMVAMTRSSMNLTITYTDQPIQYVDCFKQQCLEITPNSVNTPTIASQDNDFDF